MKKMRVEKRIRRGGKRRWRIGWRRGNGRME